MRLSTKLQDKPPGVTSTELQVQSHPASMCSFVQCTNPQHPFPCSSLGDEVGAAVLDVQVVGMLPARRKAAGGPEGGRTAMSGAQASSLSVASGCLLVLGCMVASRRPCVKLPRRLALCPAAHQTSMVRMGVAPCTHGFSALGVLVTSSLPSLFTLSQAQPLPNWVAPAALKASTNLS